MILSTPCMLCLMIRFVFHSIHDEAAIDLLLYCFPDMAKLRSAFDKIVLFQTSLTIFATIQSLVTTAAFNLPCGSLPATRRLLTTTIAKKSAQQPFLSSSSSSGNSIKRYRAVAPEIRRFGELQRSSEANPAAAAGAAPTDDDPDDLLKWERMYQQRER